MWRRRRIFDDFFRELEEVDRLFDRMFESMRSWQGVNLEEPLYWGFSVRVGPSGVPEIQTFGNVETSPTLRAGVREPYVETMVDEKNGELVVTAEIPGVTKEDIKINATESSVEIEAERDDRKYHKVVALDAEVDPSSAKARYNNGVLEIKFKLKAPPKKGVNIKVE
jgi:HSP20 family protein